MRLDEIVAHVGDDAAERARDPGEARDQRPRQPDLLDERAGVERAAAAERHGREILRIVAALDRDQADGAGHARIGDADDRLGSIDVGQAERRADRARDRLARGVDIEPRELAADRPVGVDAAEHDIGVGHGRPVAAEAVADRARIGARRFGADLEQAAAIDPGDRAAARADGRDLDHRRAHDQAEIDRGLRRQRVPAVGDQRHVEAGPAHVAGDDVGEARAARDMRGRDDAGRRTRQGRADRQMARDLGGHDAAIRLHDQELAAEAVLRERCLAGAR